MHETYGQQGLVVLGFNCADDKEFAEELLRKNSVTFKNILDPSDAARRVANDYRMSGVPLNYIIDGEGKVADAWYGYTKGDDRGVATLKKLGIK